MTDQYESPLSSRYASDYMLHLFSQQKRIETWRKLWISLAKAEHALGLPITEKQIEAEIFIASENPFGFSKN